MSHPRRFGPLLILAALFLLLPQIIGAAPVPQASTGARNALPRAAATAARPAAQGKTRQPPQVRRGKGGGEGEEEGEDEPLQRDDAFYFKRIAGDQPLTVPQAGVFRAQAAQAVGALKARQQAIGPTAYGGAWAPLGPDPIVQVSRGPGLPLIAVTGR